MKHNGMIYFLLLIIFLYPLNAISGTWSTMTNGPNLVNGIWGSSGSDVFAVSGSDFIASGNGIFHYGGNAWSAMAIPESATWSGLRGVWGSSWNDVFAVGYYGLVLHYNGSIWTDMTNGAITTNTFRGVWGSSGSDVFAVGDSSTILHYDGSSWTLMPSGTTSFLNGTWGSSGNDVFAVGDSGMGDSSTILHYDGSSWTLMPSGMTGSLYCIWGSSATDVFAVGNSGTILHYNGSIWTDMTNRAITTNTLNGVWGSSGSDVFAVGYSGTILHYDGSSWSNMLVTTNSICCIWGSSENDVFAMGYNGLVLHYGETTSTTTVPVTTITTTAHGDTTTTTPDGNTTTTQGVTTTTTSVSISTTIPSTSTTTIPSTSTTTISEPELKANFVRDKASGPPPLVVQFTDMSSGNVTSYSWDFGDNDTSAERNPTHTYLSVGTYNVSLKVEGNGGKADTEVKNGYITAGYNSPTTTTVPKGGGCPAKAVMGQDNPHLNTLRSLRNNMFINSSTGKYYTALYYKHALELSYIFAQDTALKIKMHTLLQSIMPTVENILAKEEGVIDEDTVQGSIDLIDALIMSATPALAEDLNRLKQDIQNGVIFKTFGMKIQKN